MTVYNINSACKKFWFDSAPERRGMDDEKKNAEALLKAHSIELTTEDLMHFQNEWQETLDCKLLLKNLMLIL